MSDRAHPVLELLKQRGLEVCQHSSLDFLLQPRVPEFVGAFYALMKHYSFRLMLRDVIRFQHDLALSRLVRFVDEATAAGYLAELVRMGILEQSGEQHVLPGGPVENFGTTLEWFVARALIEELSIPALHGVRLAGTATGGDFDVIGAMSGRLVYVETKSSPPKHIEDREVEVFLRRLGDLVPDLAIFLVDTNLRMLDKVVAMFHKALPKRRQLVRLSGEIFHRSGRLFVMNSKPDLVANLKACVRAYHAARFRGPAGIL